MKNKFALAVIGITFITLLTRLIRLDSVPPHLSNDEISIAYDAYSVSKTLRDEHNHFLPLSFQSHGTYKAPLAIYLTIPTTVLLGNSDYAARLPSAILGSLTVLILGLLVYELSGNHPLALVSSGILAITPWHIYSSRMALESTIALFFVVLGIYLFFYGFKRQKPIPILGGYLSLALSIYSYHTEWGFIPLLLGCIWLFYYKDLIKKPIFILGTGLFILLLIPLLTDYLHNLSTNARANTEIILRDPNVARYLSDQTLNIFQKAQVVVKAILEYYSGYTNPGYIFFNGLNLLPKEDPFQIGLFLSPLLPCFIVGLFNIKKYFTRHLKFIYSWIIISPLIPAATWGGINSVRNLISVAPYTIAIAVGALTIWNYLKNHQFLKIGALFLLIVSFVYFVAIYYYHFPLENGLGFQYGYKQIALYIKPRYNQFDKIVVDPRFGVGNIYDGVPHLYIPYYTNLNPQELLKRQAISNGISFDKYEIRPIDWPHEKLRPYYLYVVPVSNTPTSDKLNYVLRINLPNQEPAFNLYTTN